MEDKYSYNFVLPDGKEIPIYNAQFIPGQGQVVSVKSLLCRVTQVHHSFTSLENKDKPEAKRPLELKVMLELIE